MRRFGIVILGASIYDHHEELGNPRFAASAKEFLKACSDPQIIGAADRKVLNLFNRTLSPASTTNKVIEFLHTKFDDVIIYYCGHGVLPLGKKAYSIYLRSTKTIAQNMTALGFGDFIRDLEKFLVGRRVFIIIDACYSGEAIKELMDANAAAALIDERLLESLPRAGMAVFTASESNNVARALSEDKLTLFTGTLIEVLKRGVPERRGLKTLSWSDVSERVTETIRARLGYEASLPRWIAVRSPDGDITKMPFFANHAYEPTLETETESKLEQSYWAYISQQDNLDLIEDFFTKFPNGTYASLVLARMKDLIARKSAEEVGGFAARHPNSRGYAFARVRLAELEWQDIERQFAESPALPLAERIARVRAFIDGFRDIKALAAPHRELAAFEWQRIKDNLDVEAFEKFIAEFSGSAQAGEARRRLDEIRAKLADEQAAWDRVKDSRSARDLRRFLKIHVDGAHSRVARERLDRIGEQTRWLPNRAAVPQAYEALRTRWSACSLRERQITIATATLGIAAFGAVLFGRPSVTPSIQCDSGIALQQAIDKDEAGLRDFVSQCPSGPLHSIAQGRLTTLVKARLAKIDDDELAAAGSNLLKLRVLARRCDVENCSVAQEAKSRLNQAEAAERIRLASIQDQNELSAARTDLTKLRTLVRRCEAAGCSVMQEARTRLDQAEVAERARLAAIQDQNELNAAGTDLTKLRVLVRRCDAEGCSIAQQAKSRLNQAEAAERTRLAAVQDQNELNAAGNDLTKLRTLDSRCKNYGCAVAQEARSRLNQAEAAERVRLARTRDQNELASAGSDPIRLRALVRRCNTDGCSVAQEARDRLTRAEAAAAAVAAATRNHLIGPPDFWEADGSRLVLVAGTGADKQKRTFFFDVPRADFRAAGTPKKGDVAFEGTVLSGYRYAGKAYAYSGRCAPLTYDATSPTLPVEQRRVVPLTGRMPLRDSACNITGYPEVTTVYTLHDHVDNWNSDTPVGGIDLRGRLQ